MQIPPLKFCIKPIFRFQFEFLGFFFYFFAIFFLLFSVFFCAFFFFFRLIFFFFSWFFSPQAARFFLHAGDQKTKKMRILIRKRIYKHPPHLPSLLASNKKTKKFLKLGNSELKKLPSSWFWYIVIQLSVGSVSPDPIKHSGTEYPIGQHHK